MATLYVSPTGSGLRDGSSRENAGTLGSLNTYIKAAGPGGQVLLLADQGAYSRGTQLSISAGGMPDAPVTIRGVDSSGNPMAAKIAGTRAEPWAPGLSSGNDLFRLLSGANNLVFQDLAVENVGNGVFRVGADISNLTIRNVTASNVSRFIEDYVSGTATSATIDGLTVQNASIDGYSQNAIRLQYDTRNVVIQNVVGDSRHQDGELYIAGVSLAGTVHDVLISHTEMRNNYGAAGPTEYWNGDGFAAERGVYGLRFEDTLASGNADAGYDLKSSGTVLVRAVSKGNNRNYRFWSNSISLEDSSSIDPLHSGGSASTSHVWLAEGAVATIDGLTFSDALLPKTLFDLRDGDNTIHLRDTLIPPLYQDLMRLGTGSLIDVTAAPTGITLTGGTVEENAAAGTLVASLSAIDSAGDTHTFTLVGGTTNLFEVAGSEVLVKSGAVLDFETQTSYDLTIRATDQDGLSCDRAVTIALLDVQETGTTGNDVLAGGAGGDRLAGGAGNDVYAVNAAGDVVVEAAAQGTDLVNTVLAAYTLTANVENLAFTGSGDFAGTGNGLNNLVTGGAGNDTLRGANGNDTLRGGAGIDRILGGGNNDKLYGDDGDDQLFGETGRDSLYGAAGNDLLDGGGSDDVLAGGAGDDTYVVNTSGDKVVEKAGEGGDTVRSVVSFSLGANLENLVLTGTGAVRGTGNSGDNTITGNSADNVLGAGDGNDVLDGGAGNDTLIGGEGADTYLFGRGGGADLIANGDMDGAADTLLFGAGIAEDQLWFARSGSDLVASVLGTSDRTTLQGWYSDLGSQFDHLELSDGSTLAAAQVQQLVDAMSAFPLPGAVTDLSAPQQQLVEKAIAANWHSAD
ncbi:MAG TPA: cadherin domain-containing protein [Dongiaceae bacterium]|nr:cadherin domain-containing protein [Dongiaceae bacterium]